ncbi:5728_t:CDS:1, partial [Dentiscutata heterogama]
EFNWLHYEEKDDGGKMFCTLCKAAKKKNLFTQGCEWLKHDVLVKHTNTLDHQKSIPIMHNQTTIESGFRLSMSKDKLEIIQIMQHIYFLAKHHYATHGLRDLKKLNTQQFNEARDEALFGPFVGLKKVQSIVDPPNTIRSEYGSYNNDVSASEFLEAISFVIEESLSNEIQKSLYWSIQIDESNTIKQEKMLAIVLNIYQIIIQLYVFWVLYN